MPSKRQYQDISVGLNDADRERLYAQARVQGLTQTEVARKAIRWYLDNVDNIANEARDSAIAQSIRYATDQIVRAIRHGVDRICKMLARQGTAIGTLYELTWLSLPDDDDARAVFDSALNAARHKMRKHVQKDEAEIADEMKKNLEA